MSRRVFLLSSLIFILLASVQYQSTLSLTVDQEPELKNDLVVYDYTIDTDSISFVVSYPEELNSMISEISANLKAPNSGFSKTLSFVFDENSGYWTTSLAISDSNPRFIYIKTFNVYGSKDNRAFQVIIDSPFEKGLIDLGKGIENHLETSILPLITNVESNSSTVVIGDTLNLTLSVSYPFPESLSISGIMTSSESAYFRYKGNNSFSAIVEITNTTFSEITLSSINILRINNITQESLNYHNNLNYTSPNITVTNGLPVDNSPPIVDLPGISYQFLGNNPGKSLTISMNITDQNDIHLAYGTLISPNSTLLLSFDLRYNSITDK